MAEDKTQNEDVTIEPEDEQVDSFGRSKKEKELRGKLEECQKERQEYLTGWQRAKADLINARREFEEEKQTLRTRAHASVIEDILSVLDSFEMAFVNKSAWEAVDKQWRTGIEHIYTQLKTVLEDYGVREIAAEGEVFDPTLHESVEVVPTNDENKDDTVASIAQTGYVMGDRVIRPAKVRVYKYNADEDGTE